MVLFFFCRFFFAQPGEKRTYNGEEIRQAVLEIHRGVAQVEAGRILILLCYRQQRGFIV